MVLSLRPTTITDARRYVGEVHRHNLPPRGGLFAVGVECAGKLVGVAVTGRPTAHPLQDGRTVEVTRCATDGTRNACSMLYGASTRAAEALGYRLAYTYTLDNDDEDGASLKASGWEIDAYLSAREAMVRNDGGRYQTDLFGNDRRPPGPKIRWRKQLRPRGAVPQSDTRTEPKAEKEEGE